MTGVMLLLSVGLNSLALQAAEFLPPDQAFQFSSKQQGSEMQLLWQVEHGYYLYQQRISAYASVTNAAGEELDVDLPMTFVTASVIKQDRNFGEVPVFLDQAEARVDLTPLAGLKPQPAEITVEYQGCAKSGLCYNPQWQQLSISALPAVTPVEKTDITPSAPAAASAVAEAAGAGLSDLESSGAVADFLKTAGFWTTVGVFLALGIGLSLTPCILPMVPILSGVIVGHGQQLSAARGATLSSAYVLGMSMTYAVAGMLAATLGAQGNLQLYMQNPWVIGIFSLVFVALALAMFGVYNLELPHSIQNKLNNVSRHQQGGHFLGVWIMGALSALVVSPCVSAPLAGALVYISSTGDLVLGGLALFSLGIGMGLPLIALGAGGGKLVPKAGMWMIAVKNFFGVVLLGVAIWLSSRIIPAEISLLLWALLLIFYGIYTGALEPAEPGTPRLRKAASMAVLSYGFILLLGVAAGGTDPIHPLANLSLAQAGDSEPRHSEFTRVTTAADLKQAMLAAADAKQPVMLDLYADWCTACLDMEKHVFSKADVQQQLQDFAILQLDLTNQQSDVKALLDQLGLFGPPSMLFFDARGQELQAQRVQGELGHPEFLAHVAKVKAAVARQCQQTPGTMPC